MRLKATIFTLATAMLVLPACAGRKGPPDPAKVRDKVAANQDRERSLIRSTIADSERAETLLSLLAERDRLVAAHAEAIRAHAEHMRALSADYGASRQSFEQALADYNEKRAALQRDFVELLTSMKVEATAEEWKAIARYQLKKLEPRELAYGPAGGAR